MATGTYTTGGNTASYGQNNSAVGALQKSLNAKGANLAVDNKYGPLTAAAVAKYGSGDGSSGSNPVKSSSSTRLSIDRDSYDIKGLRSNYEKEAAFYNQYLDAMAARRDQQISGIKTAFDIAKGEQDFQQTRDYGARATSLITSGGGFLGGTQSQQGVLQNLQHTFDTEKTALMAKREAAILAAEQAYEDKNFEVAKEMMKSAKDYQSEIYTRQKDYSDQILKYSQENRSQAEFDMKVKNQWNELAVKYPSAGITPEDTLIDIQNKIRNSYEYKLDTRKAEADLADTYSLISNRNSAGGVISPELAKQLGAPGLAGKKEEDVIESLTYRNAPDWYRQHYQQSSPEAYNKIYNIPGAIDTDWNNFKALPDIQSFITNWLTENGKKKLDDSGNPFG